jgi:small subunit ribosomal protein S27Ae
VAKAKIGLYSTKGDQLTRTHKSCPKCGPGTFLAEHNNRRPCGKCGYAESKTPPPATAAPKAKVPKGAPAPPAPA